MAQKLAIAKKPIIHWRKTQGNPYRKKLHPAMLTESGHQELRHIWLTGKRRSLERESVVVHYDTDYVIQKLIVEVFEPLRITEPMQLKPILSKALKQYTIQCLNSEDQDS